VRDGDALYVHAEASRPESFLYVTDTREAGRSLQATAARLTFAGHVHHAALYYAPPGSDVVRSFQPFPGVAVPLVGSRRWLLVQGSVGQPRDNNPAAACAIYDNRENTLTHYRVPYDVAATAERIRRCGLPPRLADRLEKGH
jgi:diadenosine tetraphosphatase ApaH/serine/threonine PP2A family protein phosphatase